MSKASVRLNNDVGEGHHNHVVTGGSKSKFGIHYSDIDKVLKLAKKHNLKINGLHQHIGSHILEEHIFAGAMKIMYERAQSFPDLEFIDFGGSFGVPYRSGVEELDIVKLGKLVSESFQNFCHDYGRQLQLVFEPGRYLVAEAGTLLVTVTDIKHQPARTFVLVDSGFNHLLRPALYDSYHYIVNLSHPEADLIQVSIGGNICESGDLFALDREISAPQIGDILAVYSVGAYGFSMSSRYNLNQLPTEICYEL
jgi:diaminopimelate decarboxylase